MFVYWIAGAFFDDLETLTLAVGIIRSFESIGSCLSFGIGAARVQPMINLIIAFSVFCVTIPATTWVVCLVPERPKHDILADEQSATDTDNGDPVLAAKVVTVNNKQT